MNEVTSMSRNSYVCRLQYRVGYNFWIRARLNYHLSGFNWRTAIGDWNWKTWHPTWGISAFLVSRCTSWRLFAKNITCFFRLKEESKTNILFWPKSCQNWSYIIHRYHCQKNHDQYRGAKEGLTNHFPKPRGRLVQVTTFVDAYHAADKKTGQSHTGYIIFVNRAPIIWYSRQQHTVESSTLSS